MKGSNSFWLSSDEAKQIGMTVLYAAAGGLAAWLSKQTFDTSTDTGIVLAALSTVGAHFLAKFVPQTK
jgi:hypothetical protein